jgi:hypothetical protein
VPRACASVYVCVRCASSQRWWTRYALTHPEHIAIDSKGEIFHTLHWVNSSDFTVPDGMDGSEGVLDSAVSGTQPCVLHGNGDDGKVVLQEVVERLQAAGWLEKRAKKGEKYGGW